jgi:hypothetical protein
MLTIKVLFNKYGNYTCYKGNSIDVVLGDYDEAILWLENELYMGGKLSALSYVQKADIIKYHKVLAEYIIR